MSRMGAWSLGMDLVMIVLVFGVLLAAKALIE